MARSTNGSSADGDSRVSGPADGGEPRELAESRELSLEEVLKSYEQPINEEQAWAVCYQCCSGLRAPRLQAVKVQRVKGPSSILLLRDGTVAIQPEPTPKDESPPVPRAAERQLVQSLGVAIYQALDWGLDDSEERQLTPRLERLIEQMVRGIGQAEGDVCSSNGTCDEGYSEEEEQLEDEEETERSTRPVCSFHQVMALCAARLADRRLAPEHYQAVCRALFVETQELQTFLIKIKDAKAMLKKISKEDPLENKATDELDELKHRDWACLWVGLMKELRQGVKLKKVEEQPFNLLPIEFSLTPFEMLMQDIRTRSFQLRKVMVNGEIPTRVKMNAHELMLDFIRSRPPLKPAAERWLPPPPLQQPSLHDRVLAEIKKERKLRPVDPPNSRLFGSLPCLAQACPCNIKSTSCIDLSLSGHGCRFKTPSRPRVLLKAPTLAEMEEMNLSEDDDSPDSEELRMAVGGPIKRDRSFSEHDLALLRGQSPPSVFESSELDGAVRLRGDRSRTLTGIGPVPTQRASLPVQGWVPPASPARLSLNSMNETTDESTFRTGEEHQWMDEFSHPVESLALTVDEVINVRRVLVKAEMEKFLQNKELYHNLRKGRICCCCRARFPLFSWPSTCLLCKRSVCSCCSVKMKIPSKKMAHIPVYTVGFQSPTKNQEYKSHIYKPLRSLCRRSVEEEFPHLYAHGCSLRDICADCTKFVADVISSSRRSLDFLNNTPTKAAQRTSVRLQNHPEQDVLPRPDPQQPHKSQSSTV